MLSASSSQSSVDSVSIGPPSRVHNAQGYTREQLEAWDLLPMEMLEEHHDPLFYERPPLLHFGIGLDLDRAEKGESLVPWAREHGLCAEPEEGFSLGFALAQTTRNILKYLSNKYRYRVELIFPWSMDYDAVFAIYNNYDLPDNMLDDEKEGMIMDALRQVVNDPNQVPMWYYDRERAYGSDRYPSRKLKRRG
ncbi:hypothetical protein K488DRAFT_73300 [Vararia minispora EC-137]|uniref:Uncharacterized protein n=1 Tax=Vararia minispora EC-137 TaxID=1314806 RepID=A0ACB8QBG0_9AGAM|nr:hypothetical protein K488DRAFT_73300 [Vararia minispora EC-137]